MVFDLVFKNGLVVDGCNNPWFRADVGIRDNKIAYIGKIGSGNDISSDEVIDISGKVLSPGFIDMHCHSDFMILRDSAMAPKLKQGVTTQIIGQCGLSPAPINPSFIPVLDTYVNFIKAGYDPKWDWNSFEDWLNVIDSCSLGTNVGSLLGLGTVRIATMGMSDRKPSGDEIRQMQQLVDRSLKEGAFGVSTGLVYPPGVYTTPEEITEVLSFSAGLCFLYESHMRSEANGLIEAVKEVLDIAKRLDIPCQISHHKAAGRQNWGKVKETLALVEDARLKGMDITLNQYPYTYCSTNLRAILPPWVHEGGVEKAIERLEDPSTRERITKDILSDDSWDNYILNCGDYGRVLVGYSPETPEFEGKSLEDISGLTGLSPLDAAYEVIIKNRGSDVASYGIMSPEDVSYVIKSPLVMIVSDSIPPAPGAKCHPRSYGTNPRVLRKYVREEKCLSMEEAVWKMTGFPASRLGLKHKGRIEEGMDADIVVFDPQTITDKATYENPAELSVGIEYMLVNGVMTIRSGELTGNVGGHVLRQSYD